MFKRESSKPNFHRPEDLCPFINFPSTLFLFYSRYSVLHNSVNVYAQLLLEGPSSLTFLNLHSHKKVGFNKERTNLLQLFLCV